MKYKESARSPHYGRIFAYDQNGKEIQEVDVLKVRIEHEETEYTIGELLKNVAVNKENVAKIKGFEVKIESLDKKIDLLAKLVVFLNAKIDELEVE